jgi:ABC-2 type transport system ATP-binding protein
MPQIEVHNFSKIYGSNLPAVDNISFEVEAGEIFGLIGPDGAGKTTLLRSLATLLLPSQGTLKLKQMDVTKDITEIRAILGYMPQKFSLYQDLTVAQNLNFFADLFEVPVDQRSSRLNQLYQFSRLENFKSRKAGALSGGMKQKLALSCALIHTPDILLLDEPTFGVDPVSRLEFWHILHEIRKQGTTILVSTAYMDEANQCDRVALLFNGKIQAIDTPEKLRNSFAYPLYAIASNNLRQLGDYLNQQSDINSVQLFGDTLHVSFNIEPNDAYWSTLASNAGIAIESWHKIDPSIEDVFLNLMETV